MTENSEFSEITFDKTPSNTTPLIPREDSPILADPEIRQEVYRRNIEAAKARSSHAVIMSEVKKTQGIQSAEEKTDINKEPEATEDFDPTRQIISGRRSGRLTKTNSGYHKLIRVAAGGVLFATLASGAAYQATHNEQSAPSTSTTTSSTEISTGN